MEPGLVGSRKTEAKGLCVAVTGKTRDFGPSAIHFLK
jgi:hypothetical protein